MEEQFQGIQQGEQGNQEQVPGWLAGLPEDLRSNETFKQYKTVGEFAKSHIETADKVKKLEESAVNSIPKLPENATQQDRDTFYKSIGRPEKADDYELDDGGGKNAPEWQKMWKDEFFKLGLPADMAKSLSTAFNGQMAKLVEAHNDTLKQDIETASTNLKAEYGDKYEENTELAKRMWNKHGNSDFDAAFNGESSANRFSMIRFIVNMAKLTGEDSSPPGSTSKGPGQGDTGGWFPNSPKSPTGK